MKLKIILLFATIAAISLLMAYSCKENPVVQPSVPEQIETVYKPIEDSLKSEITLLKDSIEYFKKLAAKAEVKKEVAKEKVTEAKQKVDSAIKSGDTLAIINRQAEQIQAQDQVIYDQDQQLSAQGHIIEKQEATIKSYELSITSANTKFMALKTAFTDQATVLQEERKQHVKDLKKLKRAKFFNKVLSIGTAAGIGLAAIVFL